MNSLNQKGIWFTLLVAIIGQGCRHTADRESAFRPAQNDAATQATRFEGELDEVMLWTRPIRLDEVQRISNSSVSSVGLPL